MAIQDGAKFATPLELIQYYTKKVDGLLTTLTTPCCRRPGQPPSGYRFITHEEMQQAMREAALLLGYQVRYTVPEQHRARLRFVRNLFIFCGERTLQVCRMFEYMYILFVCTCMTVCLLTSVIVCGVHVHIHVRVLS